MNSKKQSDTQKNPETKTTDDDLKLIATTIRTLTMDAVQKAKSGHPGMPMGCADIAAVLWGKILKHNPDDPQWINRDRFVLSAGHGSMLLYSVLHFSGYGITLEDIKNFRQLHSITPGHPEHRVTRGVETTTGPLGQGFGNGVGMAIASAIMAQEFNSGEKDIIDHYIYALISDGDIMEGISSEAASLAGHMGLGNIIYIYDSNDITIEGSTDLAFSEDVGKRFEAHEWHVQTIDGHNYKDIEDAILSAQAVKDKPSIIIAKTTIARGSATMEGCEDSHGAPLGEEEVCASKKNIGCCGDEFFHVPGQVYAIFSRRQKELTGVYDSWKKIFDTTISGDKKKKWDRFFTKPDIAFLKSKMPLFEPGKKIATRSASGKVLEVLFGELPNILGGSADLGPSNKSYIKGYSESGKNRVGRNIHFGIREHSMGAIQNGIAYYGGFIPYTATFLSFMDYMRPSIRIAAIGKLQCIYIFTHDSIFVGEDGPTHQPVEHVAAARTIPDLTVIRPADADETVAAWMIALSQKNGPTLLSLTRQDVPVIQRDPGQVAENLSRGAYIIKDCQGSPDIIIFASGSEVHIAIEAAGTLKSEKIEARVVSFPSWELFDGQPEKYRESILAPGIPKAVVEAGIRMGWEKYAGSNALYITMEQFGLSAPYQVVGDYFGFTSENIVKKITGYLKK